MRSVLNWKITTLVFIVGTLLQSCGDNGIIEIPSSEDYLQSEIDQIEEYIAEKGYTNVDTTESRVRYVIFEEGSGAEIKPGDIVSINYVGLLMDDDTVFDTNIKAVAIANDQFIDSRTYAPLVFTHSESGWAIELAGFVPGFADGVTAAFSEMKVGGYTRLMIPSTLGYGSSGSLRDGIYTVPPNTNIVFDVYPVQVR